MEGEHERNVICAISDIRIGSPDELVPDLQLASMDDGEIVACGFMRVVDGPVSERTLADVYVLNDRQRTQLICGLLDAAPLPDTLRAEVVRRVTGVVLPAGVDEI